VFSPIAVIIHVIKEETSTVAEGGGARKRMKEIKTEIVAAKEKLTSLKAEREQLKTKMQAAKSAKEAKTDKPAT
jgi:uncharacterized protein (DUF3084 family)